jgi:hypothetical protein
VAAQEKPKVIPVDNFVRDELYPGYTQAFGTQPFVARPWGAQLGAEIVGGCRRLGDRSTGWRAHLAISKMSAAAEAARRLRGQRLTSYPERPGFHTTAEV